MRYTNICFQLIVFSSLFFMSSSAWAQNDIQAATKREKLQDLSIHLKQRSEAAQKHAKDLAKRKGWPTRKEMPDGALIEIQRLSPTGKPVYYITENIDAADTVSTDEVWTGGSAGLALDGSGMTVGEWDGGAVLSTHQELTGRVTQSDGATTTHYHATHVAGTMIASGVVANAKGMSHSANLNAYDWNSDESEMAAAAGNGLLLSNHSYGNITGWYWDGSSWYWYGEYNDTEDSGFGFYDYWGARYWDEIAYNAPFYLIVKSAGNDRSDSGPGDGVNYYVYNNGNWVIRNTTDAPRESDCGPAGYDCISSKGNAKNILTVGAVGDISDGYLAPGAGLVAMSSFSSWGPTDDGRIKPDLVANGVGLYSTYDTNDAAYNSISGTSMAAPNATGSLLLLQQHYQDENNGNSLRAATLKALVIHTADEAGLHDGPDYAYGWGLLNTMKAAELISENGGDNHRIIEATLSEGATYEMQINSGGIGSEIKVTLVWTDPHGTPVQESVDPTDIMLVNDLDLRVAAANGSTFNPWVLDPINPSVAATTGDNFRDNVEQVLVRLSGNGIYTIQISHKGNLVDDESNTAPQAFSLIISTQPSSNYELIESTDFEGGLPAGWTVIDNETNGKVWRFDDPDGRGNLTGGSGTFAIADSDHAGLYAMDTELRSASLDLSNYSDVKLNFKSDFYHYQNEVADVNVSTDGGNSWTTVWHQTGGDDRGPVYYLLDISSIVDGQNDVLISFHYFDANFEWWWQVDDVEIWGVPSNSVCGNGYELPAEKWRMISLPCEPGLNNTVGDLFSDDFVGAYRYTWILFRWNVITQLYERLDIDTPILQGQSLWIYSTENTTLNIEGDDTPITANCPGDCFQIPLTPGDHLYDMKGNPFPYGVDWKDVRVRVNGFGSLTLSEAFAEGYLSKIFNTYNGSGYDSYDDVTPGMQGVLGAYGGFWIEALDNTLLTLTLLIPPEQSAGIIMMASQGAGTIETEEFLLAADTTVPRPYQASKVGIWWDAWANWLIPQAHASSRNHSEKIPPGLAKRDAHRARHKQAIANGEEWYIRLTVEAAAEGMKDRGNVLGQLQDSEYGYDHHDLKELPPFEEGYLTVVFPHPEWNEYANDYTSDFHPLSRKNRRDSWSFEVRTDDPEREVSLFWAGPTEIMESSWLVDEATGEMIEVVPGQNYIFIMEATTRAFTWHYSGKKRKRRHNNKKW